MLRRTVRIRLPKRANWHHLGEFTMKEADQVAFRDLRSRDSAVAALSNKFRDGASSSVDWSRWEKEINHQDLVKTLKAFHSEQMKVLDSLINEKHDDAVKSQNEGWDLFDESVGSCQTSVKTSEELVRNGAKALYISFKNPPISHATQTEWLDTDQYWQAFVEKHMYHANYLNTLNEDPESKETAAAIEAETLRRWHNWDGRNVTRHNNKLLYQRPSWEYYDLYRGPLVEHMIFYLTKTGGDARTFPELMPPEWFCEIYSNRFELYNMLQRRRRAAQELGLLRELNLDLTPKDLDHDGEQYYQKWLAREGALVELSVARLMGNFIFLSEKTPIQTQAGLLKVLASGQSGKFYSLGEDVHALFFEPSSPSADEVDPVAAFESYLDHLKLTGRRYSPGHNQIGLIFHRTLASRKAGLDGRWFAAPGESQMDAFMRRLKSDDPQAGVFKDYCEEFKARWAQAEEVPADQVVSRLVEIERKYKLECEEFENIAWTLCDELAGSAKDELARIEKLKEGDQLGSLFQDGGMVAVRSGSNEPLGVEERQAVFSE